MAGAAGESDPRTRYRVSRFESLRIRVPQPLFAPASESPGSPGLARARNRTGAGARTVIELPPLPRAVTGGQTLIQLARGPELRPPGAPRLPLMALWSQTPALPRPEPRKFVTPGRQRPLTPVPELSAPPRITAGGLPVSLLIPEVQPTGAESRLAAPRPAGLPVRVFRPPEPKGVPEVAIDLPPGDPVNVIAIHRDPAPLRGLLEIPPGNQIAPDLAARGNGPAAIAATGAGEGSSATQTGAGSGQGGAAGESGEGAQQGNSGGAAGTGEQAGAGRTGNGGQGSGGSGGGTGTLLSTGVAGNGQAGTLSGPAELLPGSTPIRILHPQNGVFDVVVVQTGRSGAESALLAGRPVYSVYLNVGTAKEWVLHYCIPKSPETFRQSGPVISLGSPAKIAAPYPLLTLTPGAATMASMQRISIHGWLTVRGQFRDITAAGQDQKTAVESLMPYLKQWEFRPATRDGAPVEVEILLIVPAHGQG